MSRRLSTLLRAILVGLVCLFALGRVAYASHHCYRILGGGCGGTAPMQASHKDGQSTAKVCAMQALSPDETGTSNGSGQAAVAIAPPSALPYVAAPRFASPRPVRLGPPPAHLTVLTSFGRLRL